MTADVPPPDDPRVAAEVVALGERLAEAVALQEAGKYEQGLAVADAVAADAQVLDYGPLFARAWFRQGSLQDKAGKYEIAEETLLRAYDVAVAESMQDEAARTSALLVYVVGYRLKRYGDGRLWAVNADPLSRAVGTSPARAMHFSSLGVVAYAEGKYDEAYDLQERALAIREQALELDHPLMAISLINLANVVGKKGGYDVGLPVPI